ncbi:MAG TPA: DUF2156 domain-containing protein [Blastocatellia bacterium]|nr:DUF2156 domain-containing protein [Blastocatellia bacterium]
MAKIIGTFETLEEAQAAAHRLAANGIQRRSLSIVGPGCKHSSQIKRSLVWGGALGAGMALLLPHGGLLYLAGHLARATIVHLLGMTAKGLLMGAAAGGTIDVLRRAGLDRQAAHEASEIIKLGQHALTLEADWATTQRARLALGLDQATPDPYLVKMVFRYGHEHQSFLSLYGGMTVWSSREPEAAVVYRRVGRVAVVASAPLAAREDLAEVIGQFLDYCRRQKLDCLMLPIGAETARIARLCGMGVLQIGQSGYFELPGWRPAGDRAKKVRAGVNQARKAGVRVERYDPDSTPDRHARREIEALCQAWINTREVDALGWLLELDPFKLSPYKRYFLARAADGHLEGMLACSPIPGRRGWYLEDLIRRPDTERGVSELLVVEALQSLSAEGAELATLGTSPLAGIESNGDFKHTTRLFKLIYEHLDLFYHFKALHRFKAKFAPSFVDPEYVAIYPPRLRLRMALAVIGAFDPNGLTGVMISKLRRLWSETRPPRDEN